MSATAHITIPSPIISSGHFDVVIKDESGSTVYTGTQTNTPFDVPGLAGGNYIMYATYNGFTTKWCFPLTDCSCIPYTSAVITETIPGVRYLEITFDISGWSFCPFAINFLDADATTSTFITISSIGDLVHVSGSIYKFIGLVGGARAAIFQIYLGVTATSPPCAGGTVAYSCSPAVLADPHHPTAITITLVKEAGVWKMRFTFWGCGISCHTFTINYLQNYVNLPGESYIPDSGATTITLNCSDPSPWTTDVILNPNYTFYTGEHGVAPASLQYLWYYLNITDCCGNVNREVTHVAVNNLGCNGITCR